MTISYAYYGSVSDATNYFSMRLHEYAWSTANPADRPKALWAATQIIDTLNFKGFKNPVYLVLAAFGLTYIPDQNQFVTSNRTVYYCQPSLPEIQAAEQLQDLEFPRGPDTTVPDAIVQACYEIAHSLLDRERSRTRELENLGVVSHGYGFCENYLRARTKSRSSTSSTVSPMFSRGGLYGRSCVTGTRSRSVASRNPAGRIRG